MSSTQRLGRAYTALDRRGAGVYFGYADHAVALLGTRLTRLPDPVQVRVRKTLQRLAAAHRRLGIGCSGVQQIYRVESPQIAAAKKRPRVRGYLVERTVWHASWRDGMRTEVTIYDDAGRLLRSATRSAVPGSRLRDG